jgi:putative redox protein
MINTKSEAQAYCTTFNSSSYEAHADAPIDKGGQGAGFDPHELLEASLATCLNIIVRKRARQLGYALESVRTTVRIDRTQADVSTFNYDIELSGVLTAEERQALLDAADQCPVSQTLSKTVVFARTG